MNREQAIQATKVGSIAACVSVAATLVLAFIAIGSNSQDDLAIWNDPLIFLDAVLMSICAFGIYKKSRTAAVFMFAYFILAKIAIWIEAGSPSGIVLGLVFLYFYGKAVQGTFTFHNIEKQENSNYQTTSKLYMYIGIPFAVIFFLLGGFGILTMTGTFPSAEVQTGSELPEYFQEELVAARIIDRDDTIQYFYSYGLTSVLTGGSILTGDRVIMYFQDEGEDEEKEMVVYEILFVDISKIELIEAGNALNDTTYRIYGNSGEFVEVYLSTQRQGDMKFIEALRSELAY